MTEFLLLCLIYGWNPISIIFKFILFLGFIWLITKKEFRITIGVIALIVLIYYQPRILIVIAIILITYKLYHLTDTQKANITKEKDKVTKSISKFFKTHRKNMIYAVCILIFFIILFSIMGSQSTKYVDNKKDTKNQIANTESYNPEDIVNRIIGTGKEIILDPIDMNDYPDFNRNMDVNLYYNCQAYTGWRKNKIENNWKSYGAYRGCMVAVIYSEPDDACLGLSECSAGGTQFYNMFNLKTNQYIYSCISSDCETEFQKKLDVVRPFPIYEYISSEKGGVNNSPTTTTNYASSYTPTYSSNSYESSSKKSYDWDDDPEQSEFYEYDNFDDYYNAYGNDYDYSYDELKDMYEDERGNDRPYQEYNDYYDDIWYDYYGGYDGYNYHYDDYVDEYGYED